MAEFTPHSLQLIPYDGGLPGCVYSHWPASGRAMSPETLRSALDFLERVGAESPPRITFTGEEPMLAGTAWFAKALPLLRAQFGSLAQMVISSGLQALDKDMLALLAAHDVHVEVRLDAFPAMHDAQNGAYAFEKTFAAVCRLREKDLPFHCTCTVTADFWKNAKGIALFFAEQNLPFTIWPVVPQMNAAANCRGRVLSPSRAGVFFRELLMVYRHGIEACDNETLNAMASACQQGRNSRKPFHGCFGTVAAIGPDGLVYPCWRFYHHRDYAFGNLVDNPNRAGITGSPAWKRLDTSWALMRVRCGDCRHAAYCGGCLYGALEHGHYQDPYCQLLLKPTYDMIWSELGNEEELLKAGRITPEDMLMTTIAQQATAPRNCPWG